MTRKGVYTCMCVCVYLIDGEEANEGADIRVECDALRGFCTRIQQ